jgi:hypothetical protein
MTVVAARTTDLSAASVADQAHDGIVVPLPVERSVTVFTARVVETRGLLARIAVQLNPYDVRELSMCLNERLGGGMDGGPDQRLNEGLGQGSLRVVVAGEGFDAERVAARLDKIVGILEVTIT